MTSKFSQSPPSWPQISQPQCWFPKIPPANMTPSLLGTLPPHPLLRLTCSWHRRVSMRRRIDLWCFSGVCEGVLCGTVSSRGGSSMVRQFFCFKPSWVRHRLFSLPTGTPCSQSQTRHVSFSTTMIYQWTNQKIQSSSFLVDLIADPTRNICYTFFFLVLMIWMATPLLSIVYVEHGCKDDRDSRLHHAR